ncbi:glycosyltransferase family 4 protein, partial [Shigella boydii]|nr:glycosyltransferase family 4 protein [Shigella boydii]
RDNHSLKIVLTANSSWYIYNFRRSTIKALINIGFDVLVVVPDYEYKDSILKFGAKFEKVDLKPKSINIFTECTSLISYYKIIKKFNPQVILTFTPKANIYCGLLAYKFDAKVIPNISGLGSAFVNSNTILSQIVKLLYKIALKKAAFVFFQNEDDRQLLINSGCVNYEKTCRIFGSGVDLSKFLPSNKNLKQRSCVKFILVARLLYTKGILHYLKAAEIIKSKYPNCSFSLLGAFEKNEKIITKELIEGFCTRGIVNYYGTSDDVASIMKHYDAIVLPSFYREGVPKALIEGASSGLAILTTDNVGCRDMVQNEVNGFLCQPNDLDSLVDIIEKYILLTDEMKNTMSIKSREFAESHCDE